MNILSTILVLAYITNYFHPLSPRVIRFTGEAAGSVLVAE